MADNSIRTPGSGETIASDDVGGVKFQRVKLTTGADGTAVDTLNPADAMVAANSGVLPTTNQLFNETTFDRMRGNTGPTTLLASAARTASANSAIQTNYNGRGIYMMLVVTVAGTGNLQINILESPSNAFIAGLASVTTSTSYFIYPGATNPLFTVAVGTPIPRVWFASVGKSDGSSWTYSLTSYTIV